MIALIELLALRSQGRRPPPIPWTLLTVGTLIGRAESAAQVKAWAAVLQADLVETPQCDGTLALRCDAVWRGVRVRVIAE
jgi:hypothetical protein